MDEHRGCYRRCFSTHDGQKVLGHLLIDLGFFDEDGDATLKNYAAKIVKTLGFVDEPRKVSQFITKCFEISQAESKKEPKNEM